MIIEEAKRYLFLNDIQGNKTDAITAKLTNAIVIASIPNRIVNVFNKGCK